MGKFAIAAALLALALPAAAQNYKMAETQVFCNIMGAYAAGSVIDLYNHVPLDQSLRRTDGYVCTDIPQVCQAKVTMIQNIMRYWYGVAQQQGYETMQPDSFATADNAVKVSATSACWQSAKQHYGW